MNTAVAFLPRDYLLLCLHLTHMCLLALYIRLGMPRHSQFQPMGATADITKQCLSTGGLKKRTLGRSEAWEEICFKRTQKWNRSREYHRCWIQVWIMNSMIPAGLILTSARELTLEAAQSAGSARTVNSRPSNRDLPFAQTKKLVDSRNDREILEGLRKVISV